MLFRRLGRPPKNPEESQAFAGLKATACCGLRLSAAKAQSRTEGRGGADNRRCRVPFWFISEVFSVWWKTVDVALRGCAVGCFALLTVGNVASAPQCCAMFARLTPWGEGDHDVREFGRFTDCVRTTLVLVSADSLHLVSARA